MRLLTFVLITLSLLNKNVNAADILVLKSEHVFKGELKKIELKNAVFLCEGNYYDIPKSEIKEIWRDIEGDSLVGVDFLKENEDLCLKARTDASMYHGRKVGHFCLGFFCGGFALIGTAIANPSPYRGKDTLMKSVNKDKFDDPVYLQCYRRTAKKEMLMTETAGWLSWIILVLALRN